jgi:VanZ family protein
MPYNHVKSWMARNMLGAICGTILLVILVAGLWPFNPFPHNEVNWLQNGSGLHIGDMGIVLSKTGVDAKQILRGVPSSFEIWLKPDKRMVSGTIVTFYDVQGQRLINLSQYQDEVVLKRANRERFGLKDTTVLYAPVFGKGRRVLLSISGGARGTSIYVDGRLIEVTAKFNLVQRDTSGQIILGTSPIYRSTWAGEIYRLAVYDRATTAAQALTQYQNCCQKGRPGLDLIDAPSALYLFDEGTGNLIHDIKNPQDSLLIPKHFTVPDEMLLERPWDEYRPSWSYVSDVVVNVMGFVPLGYFFCWYAKSKGFKKRPELVILLFGFGISLLIEGTQSFLPTRSSGVTDLITNTLGTALGIYLSKFPSILEMIKKLWQSIFGEGSTLFHPRES